jgi:hypothetical protein
MSTTDDGAIVFFLIISAHKEMRRLYIPSTTRTMQLKWSQTNELVTIVIESPDAVVADSKVIDNGATVQVSGRTATGVDVLFVVELRLYEPIEETAVSIVCGGRAGPVCKMRKLRAGATWPRLTQDVVVPGCVISRDWDRWCNDDDSDDEDVPGGGPMFDAPSGYEGLLGDDYDEDCIDKDGEDGDDDEDGGEDGGEDGEDGGEDDDEEDIDGEDIDGEDIDGDEDIDEEDIDEEDIDDDTCSKSDEEDAEI